MSVRKPRYLKDGTPYWQVRFREDGKECSVSYNDPSEAEQFDKLVKQVGPAKAREICKIVATDRSLTVSAWLAQHVDRLTGVEPRTIATYRAYARNDVDDAPLGAIPLKALTAADVAIWLKSLKGSGKTVANKHGYLAGALNAAVKAGHLKANPCEGNRLPRWDREEMVFLTRDEFRILLGAVAAYWRPLVEFLVASGCRWSEATALKPGDVDAAAGTVRIRRAWKAGGENRYYELGVPKTKMSVRTINVPTTTLAKLDLDGAWLFTNSGRGRRNADGVVRVHSFNPNVWQPALARAKAEGLTEQPRIHDLRHTCASWLIQAGRPLPAVQAHLGHESITTTVGVYGHLDRASGQGNADAIAAILT